MFEEHVHVFNLNTRIFNILRVFEVITRVAKTEELIEASQHVLLEPLGCFLNANIFKHYTANNNNMTLLQVGNTLFLVSENITYSKLSQQS